MVVVVIVVIVLVITVVIIAFHPLIKFTLVVLPIVHNHTLEDAFCQLPVIIYYEIRFVNRVIGLISQKIKII